MKLFAKKQAGYQDDMTNIRLSLKQHKLWLIALVCVTLFFSVLLVYMSLHQRVLLIPHHLTQQSEVGVSSADKHYLIAIATDDTTNFFTFDPDSIQQMSAQFLDRVSASLYSDTQRQLLLREKEVTHNGVSQAIYIGKQYVLTHTNTVVIEGRLKKWIANILQPGKKVKVHVTYHFINGMPFIVRWEYDVKS